MERIVQYLDEFEDLICAVMMAKERLRRALQILLIVAASILLQTLGVLLALSRPPLALAAVSLMIVGMLYNVVTSRSPCELIAS